VNSYIESHKDRFGVEPICDALQVAPSSYYSARKRPVCARRRRDEELKPAIRRVFDANYQVYGARKVWRQLNRQGVAIPRCRTERLMRQMGLVGRVRGKKKRTTIADPASPRPADLVERQFTATAPNQLWVADLTYVATWSGFAYTAFVIDVFARRIVGWRVSNTLRTDLALDALDMAIWSRGPNLDGLVHHSDRGVQYLAIRYTERLAVEGAVNSVGSKGDSYDNALAESINSLYKSELITMRGPWRSVADVELATCAWVHWFNTERILWPIGGMSPAEFEARWLDRPENQPPGSPTSPATDKTGMNTPVQSTLLEGAGVQ